jgi:hypothetical protein
MGIIPNYFSDGTVNGFKLHKGNTNFGTGSSSTFKYSEQYNYFTVNIPHAKAGVINYCNTVSGAKLDFQDHVVVEDLSKKTVIDAHSLSEFYVQGVALQNQAASTCVDITGYIVTHTYYYSCHD